MREADKKRFAGLLMVLGETYDKQISNALTRIYWDALERYPIETVEEAARKHIANRENGRFWPKPGDLIDHIPKDRPEHRLIEDRLPPPVNTAKREEAMRKILEIIERVRQ